jgi:UDP-4-amino-4,6-dideoxy-N-acetyl-beta-L-altrosamine transaminase
MKPIPYGRQEITEADVDAVVSVLKSDYLTQGPQVPAFEKSFADFCGAKYAVAVSNGTAALHLAAMVAGVSEGVRVITSPVTFVASANCIRYCGGEIFFADIDPDTFLLDVKKTEQLIQSKPAGFFSGIIPVNLAGYPADLAAFRKLAEKYNLWIIEDACHSPGAELNGKCGNGELADMTVFSFHPVKHIACGEGGMITTNNKAYYEKLLILRSHGITRDPDLLHENHGGWYYEMQTLGYNYRLTEMQAALGLSQLTRLNDSVSKRNKIAERYDKELKDLPIQLPKRKQNLLHAFHLYIIRTNRRKELYDFLRAKNIFCQVHYIPVHLMPYYQDAGFKKGDFPGAEKYYKECLSIPMYPSLEEKDLDFIIESIHSFFGEV